jgi:FMN phosphatase YigB (HAD superfamily)
MAIKMVLFDLDGTLLPMDQDKFTKVYFKLLAEKLAPRGYDPAALVDAIWAGTAAMVKNDGGCKNEDAFWKKFAEIFGERVYDDKPLMDEYYRNEFQKVAAVCGYNPLAADTVKRCRAAGLRVALATNPIFPAIATESRMKWAGLDAADFELYTTYENAGYSKPNLDYYRDILKRLDCRAEECLMVGNDVGEDMVAEKLGMQVFLITDCMINRKNSDISRYAHGDFRTLQSFLKI